MGAQLGYSEMYDWYRVTPFDVHKYGGSGLLHLYNNSCNEALQDIFPEHKWNISKPKREVVGGTSLHFHLVNYQR